MIGLQRLGGASYLGFSGYQNMGVYGAARRGALTPVEPVPAADPVQEGRQPRMFAPSARLPEPQLPELRQGADPVEMAVRGRIRYLAPEELEELMGKTKETQSPAEVFEEGQCQTCENRKYQDGSDDPGVSFKTPTKINPEQAASAVRGHEQEHVVRERAKAAREDRKVLQQTVTLRTAICPECGKSYVSGGTTRTVTAAVQEKELSFDDPKKKSGAFEAVA